MGIPVSQGSRNELDKKLIHVLSEFCKKQSRPEVNPGLTTGQRLTTPKGIPQGFVQRTPVPAADKDCYRCSASREENPPQSPLPTGDRQI